MLNIMHVVEARPNTERPIIITSGTNRLVASCCEDILKGVEGSLCRPKPGSFKSGLWDGGAAGRLVEVVLDL
jgi:UDP-N-acetylglucosamine 2-epimerase (non-hydrolysing)